MIRALQASDVSWIVTQEPLVFGHTLGATHYQTLLDLSMLFGYIIDQQAALICSINEEHVQIENLFVLPPLQRQGKATTLLQHLLNELPSLGARYVSLEVRVDLPHVVRLYQSMGFQTVKRLANYYPDQTDAIYMVYERSLG